jgi:hypothetical protein
MDLDLKVLGGILSGAFKLSGGFSGPMLIEAIPINRVISAFDATNRETYTTSPVLVTTTDQRSNQD